MPDSIPSSSTTGTGAAPTQGRLEYWLKTIPLITSAIAAVLALIPQTANLFGKFDYTAEALLTVCVIGIIVFAITLVLHKPSQNNVSQNRVFSIRRIVGIILILAAPLLAFLLWLIFLRLPPEIEQRVEREIALGDTELLILNDPAEARIHYLNALQLAPRRGSIRSKIQVAEERMR